MRAAADSGVSGGFAGSRPALGTQRPGDGLSAPAAAGVSAVGSAQRGSARLGRHGVPNAGWMALAGADSGVSGGFAASHPALGTRRRGEGGQERRRGEGGQERRRGGEPEEDAGNGGRETDAGNGGRETDAGNGGRETAAGGQASRTPTSSRRSRSPAPSESVTHGTVEAEWSSTAVRPPASTASAGERRRSATPTTWPGFSRANVV